MHTPTASRRVQWRQKLRDVDALRDGRGKKIDRGIWKTVAMLQLVGLHTRQSCAGHLHWGLAVPWVDLDAPAAAPWREQRLLLEEQLAVLEEGTKEFTRVLRERDRLWQREEQLEAHAFLPVFGYLAAFSTGRCVPVERRILLESGGRLTVQGGVLQPGRDRITRAQKLREYQMEMRLFTAFLQQTFFSDGVLPEQGT